MKKIKKSAYVSLLALLMAHAVPVNAQEPACWFGIIDKVILVTLGVVGGSAVAGAYGYAAHDFAQKQQCCEKMVQEKTEERSKEAFQFIANNWRTLKYKAYAIASAGALTAAGTVAYLLKK